MAPLSLVITCEHAAWQVPPELAGLGLDRDTLHSHASWDPGALPLAQRLAEANEVELHAGAWSRLVVDLNRDPGGRAAVPEIAFEVAVPGNQGLAPEARAARLDAYHAPYWSSVHRAIEAGTRRGRVLHLSVHTFDPGYGSEPRPWDFGVLHDPDTPFEGRLARSLETALGGEGAFLAAPNVPYDGRSDFLVTSMRRRFAPERYAGILLEVSQRHLGALGPVTEHLIRAVATTARRFGSTEAVE